MKDAYAQGFKDGFKMGLSQSRSVTPQAQAPIQALEGKKVKKEKVGGGPASGSIGTRIR